jgi:patatin-like phospholipase/acyl hydrolase
MFTGCKYNNKALIDIANEIFGNKKLTDSNNLLCIPSYDLSTGKNTIFKYPHKEGNLSRDKDIYMKDVAIATSAAPTFFPPHQIDSKNCTGYHIDGGIWANNPILIGITDALKYFVGENKEYTDYEVLSIGNINKNYSQVINSSWINRFWNIFRLPTLIEMMMDSNGQSIHHWSKTICENTKGKYHRIESFTPSYDNVKDVTMDNTNKNFIDYMKATGKRDALEMCTKDNIKYNPNIAKLFESKKTYIIKNDEL